MPQFLNFSIDELQCELDHAVASGETRGCQLAVYIGGERIAALHAGYADLERTKLVDNHTLFPVYSAGKAVAATVLHKLVELGCLGYDSRVADLWPEYARNGKAATTLADIMTHRSGVWQLPDESSLERLLDWEHMCRVIADTPATDEPGRITHYQSLTFSWLAGEIARRASGGTNFKELVNTLVTTPLGGADIVFGADDTSETRTATLDVNRRFPREKPDPRRCWLPLCRLLNHETVRRAVLPACGALASADGLARHMAALIDIVDGVRLLNNTTVGNAVRLYRDADDPIVFKPTTWEIFGLGYVLSGPRDNLGRIFGHGGYGGSEGIADRETHIAVGFTTATLDLALAPELRSRLYHIIGILSREWNFSTRKR